MATRRATGGDALERTVVAAFVALALAPFVVAATRDDYWDGVAPFATLLVAVPVFALVQRRRWAWLLLLVFQAAVLISFAFEFATVLALVLNLVSFALLISPPMRSYVGEAKPAAQVGSGRAT